MVEGSISVSNYEDKEGNKRTMTDIIAQNIQFLSKKQSSENNSENMKEDAEEAEENDPFADFGSEVDIDNFLE